MTSEQPPRRAASAGLAVALALAAAAALDRDLAAMAAAAPPAAVAVGRFVTDFGTSAYMFAAPALVFSAAVLALGRGQAVWRGGALDGGSLRFIAERALYLAAAVAASGIVDQAMKHLIGRARPRLLRLDGAFRFEPLSIADAFASFPSGHTTSAFAAAVALGAMRPDWRGRLLAAAVLVGASRVLVGAHYPSDVVGGAALGIAVSLATARAFARRGLAFALVGGRAVVKPLRNR